MVSAWTSFSSVSFPLKTISGYPSIFGIFLSPRRHRKGPKKFPVSFPPSDLFLFTNSQRIPYLRFSPPNKSNRSRFFFFRPPLPSFVFFPVFQKALSVEAFFRKKIFFFSFLFDLHLDLAVFIRSAAHFRVCFSFFPPPFFFVPGSIGRIRKKSMPKLTCPVTAPCFFECGNSPLLLFPYRRYMTIVLNPTPPCVPRAFSSCLHPPFWSLDLLTPLSCPKIFRSDLSESPVVGKANSFILPGARLPSTFRVVVLSNLFLAGILPPSFPPFPCFLLRSRFVINLSLPTSFF